MNFSEPVATRIPTRQGEFAFAVIIQRILLGNDHNGTPVYTRSAHYALWPWGINPGSLRNVIVHPEDSLGDFFIAPRLENQDALPPIPRKQALLAEAAVRKDTLLLVPAHEPLESIQALQADLLQKKILSRKYPLPDPADRELDIRQAFLQRLGANKASSIRQEDNTFSESPFCKDWVARTDMGAVRIDHFREFRPLILTPDVHTFLYPGEKTVPLYFEAADHFAFIFGDALSQASPMVRIHSSCITGDKFGSLRCDCGPECRCAGKKFAEHGGIMVMQEFEGRGLPIEAKVCAYNLQQFGFPQLDIHGADIRRGLLKNPVYDTYTANRRLGYPDEMRTFDTCANYLTSLGVTTVRLVGQNPLKYHALTAAGLHVPEMIPITRPQDITEENAYYAMTKRDSGGHEGLRHALG